MERRKFIKESLKKLPVLILTPSVLASSCEKANQNENTNPSTAKTVIIIGAGISGLAAAKRLKEKGFNVVVLESQERIGGRLRTNRTLGLCFDEGASWIHGTEGNPLLKLADESGMTSTITNDDSIVVYDIHGVEINDTVYSQTEEKYYNILETLKNSGSLTQSFEATFNKLYPTYSNDRLWKFLLSTYATFDRGDLDKMSSLYYDEGKVFGEEEKISTNGYDVIPTYLAKNLNIKLNQRVSKVDYSNDKIQITHNNTISEANYVLVTVPLGVLKSNSIQFTPVLPTNKQHAIQKIGMNCVNKFLLNWNTSFWDDEQYIAYTPETKDKFNYFLNLKKIHPTFNTLMTFAYADYGRQTENMSDEKIMDEIMSHLKDIYGTSTSHPISMLRTKWNSNENTFGSYSYVAMETEMQHFDQLAEEVNDKLFFAGEHTNRDYFSTAHGAYLSGLREADKIIALQ